MKDRIDNRRGARAAARGTIQRSLLLTVPVLAALALPAAVDPASAAPAPPAIVPAGQVVIAAAGADATLQSMGGILTGQNQFNIPTVPATPFAVPGDANCSDLAYVTGGAGPGQVVAPISAGTGLDALKAQEAAPAGQKGCIDIARSSAPPRGLAKDPASFEYYAFSLDAVAWASPSLAAPATLTKEQLKSIYNCTITDWSAIPGAGQGPIQRYFAQPGSGTGSFFQSDLLDGQDPLVVSNANCPPVKRILQSEGRDIDPADIQKAILPYSVGAWIYQTNNHINPTIDVRNGVRLGGITTASVRGNAAGWNAVDGVYQPDTAGVVNEQNVKLNNANPAYPGIRYMFNVTDTVSPNYSQANAIVGFNNVPGGAKSPLCSDGKKSVLLSFGFGPLPSAGNPGGTSNLAGATCRKFTN